MKSRINYLLFFLTFLTAQTYCFGAEQELISKIKVKHYFLNGNEISQNAYADLARDDPAKAQRIKTSEEVGYAYRGETLTHDALIALLETNPNASAVLQDHHTLENNGKTVLAVAGLWLAFVLAQSRDQANIDGAISYYFGVVTFVALSAIGIFFMKYGKDLTDVVEAFNRKNTINPYECAAC